MENCKELECIWGAQDRNIVSVRSERYNVNGILVPCTLLRGYQWFGGTKLSPSPAVSWRQYVHLCGYYVTLRRRYKTPIPGISWQLFPLRPEHRLLVTHSLVITFSSYGLCLDKRTLLAPIPYHTETRQTWKYFPSRFKLDLLQFWDQCKIYLGTITSCACKRTM